MVKEGSSTERKMIIVDQHIVPQDVRHIRLIDYLVGKFLLLPSRTSIKKAIKRGEILVNGVAAEQAMIVQKGQKIALLESMVPIPKVFELEMDIIFEDEYIAVIDKPAGFPVSGNRYRTIQNALAYNIKPSTTADGLKWMRPIHRLDVPTSGLLIIAKTAKALMNLGHQLQERKIRKQYRAVVNGKTPQEGTISTPINDREALSEFKTIEHVRSLKTEYLSLVDLNPLTGRTHQLRIHMANEGFPIVGDDLYINDQPLLKGKGLFLCAVGLEFIHPILQTGVQIEIDQPDKFTSLLKREAARWKKYN